MTDELLDADIETVLLPGTYSVRVGFSGRVVVDENESPTIGDVVVGIMENCPADWNVQTICLTSTKPSDTSSNTRED